MPVDIVPGMANLIIVHEIKGDKEWLINSDQIVKAARIPDGGTLIEFVGGHQLSVTENLEMLQQLKSPP
jgi:hypothetical protein